MRSTTARLAVAALVAVAACGRGDNQLESGSAGGSSPVAARRALRLSPGATVDLRSETSISSRRQRAGAPVSATSVTAAINGNGDTVIPAGARFTGRVTSIAPAETPRAQGRFVIAIDEVSFGGHTYPVAVEVTQLGTQRVGRGITTGDAGKVGAGAVIGGVAGRVIGGNARGTVIGAAAGAAAGGVYAHETRDIDIRLPAGGTIKIAFIRPFERPARQVAS